MTELATKAVDSAHTYARVITVFLMLGIGLNSVATVSTYWQIELLKSAARGEVLAPGAANRNDSRQEKIRSLNTLMSAITGATFLMWMYRSHSLLPLLGAQSLEYSPGWAIGAFIIPILSMFRPFQVMSEIWGASNPNSKGWQSWKWEKPPSILSWWWGLFVLKILLTVAFNKMAPQLKSPDIIAQFLNQCYVELSIELIYIPAAIAAILALSVVGKRQVAGLQVLTNPSILAEPTA
jgi:Domain of unknown function (DUF4328)